MDLLRALGGEEGCRRLSEEFYSRVAKDSVLKPLFPGKSLRCATEAFGAFLVQFLGGDEAHTQHRSELSLRESHARFTIGPTERSAWLQHMRSALDTVALDEQTRLALTRFFTHSSAYVIGKDCAEPQDGELGARWQEQLALDATIAAIHAGRDDEALTLAPPFAARPSLFVGVLARMIQTGRPALLRFAVDAIQRDPAPRSAPYNGRFMLHYACGAGCIEMVRVLLDFGVDANLADAGNHTPLYRVANGSGMGQGPEVVEALVRAGADVNASAGVTGATPLHMAARRGHLEIARRLLDFGAALDARDRKGDTPLQRAINCRKEAVAKLLRERAATAGNVR
jgi:hemoglobin